MTLRVRRSNLNESVLIVHEHATDEIARFCEKYHLNARFYRKDAGGWDVEIKTKYGWDFIDSQDYIVVMLDRFEGHDVQLFDEDVFHTIRRWKEGDDPYASSNI